MKYFYMIIFCSAMAIADQNSLTSLMQENGLEMVDDTDNETTKKNMIDAFRKPQDVHAIAFNIQISRTDLHDEKTWALLVQKAAACGLQSIQNSTDSNRYAADTVDTIVNLVEDQLPYGIFVETNFFMVKENSDISLDEI
jgi:PBP1b-binding outer membrane lipoprotein LpoB